MGDGRRDYWATLAALDADAARVDDAARDHWPAPAWAGDAVSRRNFLKLAGASAALAGLGACMREPAAKILPYTSRPAEVTPGVPLHYATAMVIDGYATGLLVESHEGRPTKVEGNPGHPASLGAAGVYEQASVLGLYDPHRARTVRAGSRRSSWDAFVAAFGGAASGVAPLGARGAGLHLLLEPTSSPLTAELLARLRARYPEVHVHFHAPLASAAPIDAARAVLGAPLVPQYDFTRADVVLAVDADFTSAMPFHLRYARHFADRRRVETPGATMNRLYAVESTLTPTGSLADHRLRARTGDAGRVLAAIVRAAAAHPRAALTIPAESREYLARIAGGTGADRVLDDDAHRAWIEAVAGDLVASTGRSIVIVGERQPAAVHALAYLLTDALHNVGASTWYSPPPVLEAGERSHDLATLVSAMQSGEVETLVIAGANPAYTAPADADFVRAMRRVHRTAYLGLYENETARASDWFVPAAHYLEAWDDARAYDGTVSIVQPLIAPLYDGHTTSELLAVLAGATPADAHALLRASWTAGAATDGRARRPLDALAASLPALSDDQWDRALQEGIVADTAFPRATPAARWTALPTLLDRAAPAAGPLELTFARDARVYDGRFADNAWLQELPDPVTKIAWDNAALVSPRTAARMGVDTGDVLALHLHGRSARAPVFVLPGQADDAITLALGYGRGGEEPVARDVGVNAFALRTWAAPYFDAALTVERVPGAHHDLANTQTHWRLEGRPVALATTIDAYRRDPDFARAERGRVLSLYQPHRYDHGDQWAMTIDLGTCTGCSACVVACQAENNIPVVGREGVLDRREMHWLRIDRYVSGPDDDPRTISQPMLCQQCEQAPCEYVCPVNATVHSEDGLNEMVYNRCVGTRFCSNNCPYKVRRFNWFNYNAEVAATERMAKNPEVTVRARGVMEKCTFCVQRIRRAQIDAQVDGRGVRDGEVVTACQQACPTRAIVFGSYTDPESAIVRTLAIERGYSALHDLGTEPRVRYLARITNPNPTLPERRDEER